MAQDHVHFQCKHSCCQHHNDSVKHSGPTCENDNVGNNATNATNTPANKMVLNMAPYTALQTITDSYMATAADTAPTDAINNTNIAMLWKGIL
jgi:hypothetical protein